MTNHDRFAIDGHKLMCHIPRLYKWMQGEDVYPIYMEIGLTGRCNQRCNFCAFDFYGYKADLDTACLKGFIRRIAQKGVKSVLYSGEGEPLLHKDAVDIVRFTKKTGIDVALSTNASMLDKKRAEGLMGHLSWVRVSLNAGSPRTYSLIHGVKRDFFKLVIDNIRQAVRVRDRGRHGCAIGVQFLLLPQNHKEVVALARRLRDLGVDYLAVKPYSRHPSSKNKVKGLDYKAMFFLEERLKRYSSRRFQVVFRRGAMEKIGQERPYARCLGLSFITHVTAEGDVCPCNAFVGKKKFMFGNIYKQDFEKLWRGRRRKKAERMIHADRNMKACRYACRMDDINRYLWILKNPGSHVNFI